MPVVIAEQVAELGGSERLVGAITELYPTAPIVALGFDSPCTPSDALPEWIRSAHVVPGRGRRRHYLSPLYARRMRAAPPLAAEVLLHVVHYGWSLAYAGPAGARRIAYSAGVPRAFYSQYAAYFRDYPAPLRPLLRAWLPLVRRHYEALMRLPHRVVTSSRESARMLGAILAREPEIVHPPVRTGFFTPAPRKRDHFLAVARLGPQKRIDVLLDAFRRLDEKLVVAGCGPWLDRLRRVAPANVEFTGYVTDEKLRELYRGSHALICPSVEDFGIVMAEAHACGVPVIAPQAGGALDIVSDPELGVLLEPCDAASIAYAVESGWHAASLPKACRASAERFSEMLFKLRIREIVDEEAGVFRTRRLLGDGDGRRRRPPHRADPSRRADSAVSDPFDFRANP